MAATWEIQVAASIESLIEDWKSSVVKDITSSDDTYKLTDYALHLSRILAYPGLDVSAILSMIDSMGGEVVQMVKKDLATPRRPTGHTRCTGECAGPPNHVAVSEKRCGGGCQTGGLHRGFR